LALDLGGGVTMELVLIPDGKFKMGSPELENGRDKYEGPQHRVRIAKPFYMGKYEVTQAQWKAVMGYNPSRFEVDDRPVENVSWHDCRDFCGRVSRLGRRVRLPSEAEWEYACRAGTTTPFYFGANVSTDQANYDGTYPYAGGPKGAYRKETTPVGTFPGNAFGLFDMHGNVWEWCEDVRHDNYTGAPSDGSAWVADGDQNGRIVRGGAWNDYEIYLRSASRNWLRPDSRHDLMGFRVAAGAGPVAATPA
jgi:formylglycine-generating enzyme required for sulfatase activity